MLERMVLDIVEISLILTLALRGEQAVTSQ
jgi:hypothetical protein